MIGPIGNYIVSSSLELKAHELAERPMIANIEKRTDDAAKKALQHNKENIADLNCKHLASVSMEQSEVRVDPIEEFIRLELSSRGSHIQEAFIDLIKRFTPEESTIESITAINHELTIRLKSSALNRNKVFINTYGVNSQMFPRVFSFKIDVNHLKIIYSSHDKIKVSQSSWPWKDLYSLQVIMKHDKPYQIVLSLPYVPERMTTRRWKEVVI